METSFADALSNVVEVWKGMRFKDVKLNVHRRITPTVLSILYIRAEVVLCILESVMAAVGVGETILHFLVAIHISVHLHRMCPTDSLQLTVR